MRLVACCAAEDIPLSLLLRPGLAAEDFDAVVAPSLVPLPEDDLARDEAVAELRRFSLISALRGGLVSVHRLIQAITSDRYIHVSPAPAKARASATRMGGIRIIGGSHRPDGPQFSVGTVVTLRARGPVFAWPAD